MARLVVVREEESLHQLAVRKSAWTCCKDNFWLFLWLIVSKDWTVSS